MLSTLEALFSSAARVQILRLFLLKPGSQFYQREIERETGQPIRAVQREVKRLEEIELLLRSTEGNRVFYRLNPGSPLLAELTALFQKADGAEVAERVTEGVRAIPREPSSIDQPFAWMESPPTPSLPPALKRMQTDSEWDRTY